MYNNENYNNNRQESYEERARREKAPIQYRLYKGIKGKNGALRMNLKRPYTSRDPKKKEGVVFLEMAPTISPNVYDWENQKVIIALSIVDIPKIILYLRNPNHESFSRAGKLSIMHDKGAGTIDKGKHMTTLEVEKPDNMRNFMFKLFQTDNEKKVYAGVPVSPEEAIVIGTLLQTAIPVLLSWTQ